MYDLYVHLKHKVYILIVYLLNPFIYFLLLFHIKFIFNDRYQWESQWFRAWKKWHKYQIIQNHMIFA